MALRSPGRAASANRTANLTGRRAIVTGVTTGIARSIAVLLASEGVRVFTCRRDEQHIVEALGRINQVGEGDGISVDLPKPDELRCFSNDADAWLGGHDNAVIIAAVPARGHYQGICGMANTEMMQFFA